MTKPSAPYFFGYWRPWDQNNNFLESYLDYKRDQSLAKYSADIVGKYIEDASNKQIESLSNINKELNTAISGLTNQISQNLESLSFINRNLDVQIEQNKLSNLLLKNIADLLLIPDKEKERLQYIENGLKFFVNAKHDEDFFKDSLDELEMAESLKKQDYFVLYIIGCIYINSEKLLNPEKAIEYFIRSAKYASIENSFEAIKLLSFLYEDFSQFPENMENYVSKFVSDSYEKAAFASYIIGKDSDALNFQAKAVKLNPSSKNLFQLAKYEVRNRNVARGILTLSEAIENFPELALGIFKDVDLFNEPEIVKLVSIKNEEINDKIANAISKVHLIPPPFGELRFNELTKLKSQDYIFKRKKYQLFESEILIQKPLVEIGEQIWLAKNLDTTRFINGDSIDEAKNAKDWIDLFKNKKPAWCYLNFAAENKGRFGIIYNWYAVMDERKLAPPGFRISSRHDWEILSSYLGGDEIAGYKLKNTEGWNDSGNGSNECGFMALPGGTLAYAAGHIYFLHFGYQGFWLSLEQLSKEALLYSLSSKSNTLTTNAQIFKESGFYIRCIKE